MVLSWELCLCIPLFNSLVFTSTYMDGSLQGLGALCALLTTQGPSLMQQSNLFISSRAHSCPFCSDICSSIILSSKDHPFSLRHHRCLVIETFVLHLFFLQGTLQIVSGNTVVCAFFIYPESFHSWDMCIYFGTFLPLFLQEQVCSSTYSCSRGMNPWLTISGGLI